MTVEELRKLADDNDSVFAPDLAHFVRALRQAADEIDRLHEAINIAEGRANDNPHSWPKLAAERDALQARIAKLEAVAEAAKAGPCRHDSSHTGDTCALCNALAALEAAP